MDFPGHDTHLPQHVHHPLSAASVESTGSTSGASTSNTRSTIRQRASIACRRCRRMRSKCVHDKAQPPCKACDEAGLEAEDCIFPVRGQPDDDRQYRHPRVRSTKPGSKNDTAKSRRSLLDSGSDEPGSSSADYWEILPPLDEVVDSVNRFIRHHFQLGFIPKKRFTDQLRKDYRSVDLFLLLSILSVSSRLSPALIRRFGTGVKAAEFFMVRAADLAVIEIYQEPPTLERCQAFYLLSIAQEGSGITSKSHINMGIAMRLATLMRLHREETYHLPNPTPDQVVHAESARRTMWLLHSQDSLRSGPYSPVSLVASDITALLPSDEVDFAAGRLPKHRAALADTLPAIKDPSLVSSPDRSLFASLMQIHYFWGIVSRRTICYDRSPCPWDPGSESAQMMEVLQSWESSLPKEHTWSNQILKRHKAGGQDQGYLDVTMMTRLCNIVARRPYLVDIIKLNEKTEQERPYFNSLSVQLFSNVRGLFEQIDAQFMKRTADECVVGTQMTALCVYSCGLFSVYLCKYPKICPDQAITSAAPLMLSRTRSILLECKEVWPLASRWLDSLETLIHNPSAMPLAAESSLVDMRDLSQDILSWDQAHPVQQESQDISSSFTSSTYSQPSPFSHHRHQLPPQHSEHSVDHSKPDQDQNRDVIANHHHHHPNTFALQPGSHLVMGSDHAQPPSPHNPMYIPRGPIHGHAPVGVMNDLLGTFHPQQFAPGTNEPTHYAMGTPTMGFPGTNASVGASFYPMTALGPRDDGYENELRSYIGGTTQWMRPSG